MIGYSLSFCVKDIIEGRVDLKNVERIVAGTCIPVDDDEAWNRVLATYSAFYWRNDPFKACDVVRQLRAEGKIDQPRLTNPEYTHYIGQGHWEKPIDVDFWY